MTIRQVIIKFRGGASDSKVDSAILDTLNWGSGQDDSVRFTEVNGIIVQFNWTGILFVRESNIPQLPPADPPVLPALPNWRIDIYFREQSGSSSFPVTEAVKDQLLTDLSGVGSEDTILTFDTLSNYRLRCPSKGIAKISFTLQS